MVKERNYLKILEYQEKDKLVYNYRHEKELGDGFRISIDHIVILIIPLIKIGQMMWSVAQLNLA